MIAVLTTGGTIASTRGADGISTPAALDVHFGPDVVVTEVFARDSASLTLSEMQQISDAVAHAVATGADGVVVLHGTDSMEETAILLALQHGSAAVPILLTGAQRTADQLAPDGPANLRLALEVASDPGRTGVQVAFGGRVLAPAALSKRSTLDLDAYASSPLQLPRLTAPVGGERIDVVAAPPGGDALHLHASLAAGARGIVLEALGAGNASAAVVEGVRHTVAVADVPVVLTSRVPEGRLAATYGGGGGGADLVAAGATLSPVLRAGQARVLLGALVASRAEMREIRGVFARLG